MATQETRNTLKFTKMCKHWRVNGCLKGNECHFAHSAQELQEAPSLLGTKLCFQFKSKGQCSKGYACTFAHGQQELRSMPVEAASPVRRASKTMTKLTKLDKLETSSELLAMDMLQMVNQLEVLQERMKQLVALRASFYSLHPGLQPCRAPQSPLEDADWDSTAPKISQLSLRTEVLSPAVAGMALL